MNVKFAAPLVRALDLSQSLSGESRQNNTSSSMSFIALSRAEDLSEFIRGI